MRYRLNKVGPRGYFRLAFFIGWVVWAVLLLAVFVFYLFDTAAHGYSMHQFLEMLLGTIIGPPLLSLITAGLGLVVVRMYNRLARKRPLVLELDLVEEEVDASEGE